MDPSIRDKLRPLILGATITMDGDQQTNLIIKQRNPTAGIHMYKVLVIQHLLDKHFVSQQLLRTIGIETTMGARRAVSNTLVLPHNLEVGETMQLRRHQMQDQHPLQPDLHIPKQRNRHLGATKTTLQMPHQVMQDILQQHRFLTLGDLQLRDRHGDGRAIVHKVIANPVGDQRINIIRRTLPKPTHGTRITLVKVLVETNGDRGYDVKYQNHSS